MAILRTAKSASLSMYIGGLLCRRIPVLSWPADRPPADTDMGSPRCYCIPSQTDSYSKKINNYVSSRTFGRASIFALHHILRPQDRLIALVVPAADYPGFPFVRRPN